MHTWTGVLTTHQPLPLPAKQVSGTCLEIFDAERNLGGHADISRAMTLGKSAVNCLNRSRVLLSVRHATANPPSPASSAPPLVPLAHQQTSRPQPVLSLQTPVSMLPDCARRRAGQCSASSVGGLRDASRRVHCAEAGAAKVQRTRDTRPELGPRPSALKT